MRSDNPEGRERPSLFSDDFDRPPASPPNSPFLFDSGDEDLSPDEEETVEPSGTGKAFLTMAIVGGLVIVIVGVALWLRTGTENAAGLGDNNPPSFAEKQSLPPLPPTGPPPTLAENSPGPPPGAPASRPVPEPAAAQAPAEPMTAVPAPEPEKTAAVLEPPRPRPTPASLRSAEEPATGDPRALVAAGQLSQAARAGRRLMMEAGAGAYTLQVLVACKPETVQRAFRKVSDQDLTLVPVTQGGKQCYRLCWGTYPGLREAKDAAPATPDYFLKEGKPRPLRIGDL